MEHNFFPEANAGVELMTTSASTKRALYTNTEEEEGRRRKKKKKKKKKKKENKFIRCDFATTRIDWSKSCTRAKSDECEDGESVGRVEGMRHRFLQRKERRSIGTH